MSNMDYCRFENTLADLRDCMDALDGGVLGALSSSEQEAAEALIRVCVLIAREHGDLT